MPFAKNPIDKDSFILSDLKVFICVGLQEEPHYCMLS
uniref:Uncharacterized protein n=1 Tax=Anguilla anguilla TaxID=7936 RepID=A0A0E9TU44_ANGAN